MLSENQKRSTQIKYFHDVQSDYIIISHIIPNCTKFLTLVRMLIPFSLREDRGDTSDIECN